MVLGPQFENTFHEDKDVGFDLYSHRHPDKPHEIQVTDEPKKGVAYQGMFFDPSVGTGRKEDPLVPEEERKKKIRSALHLEGEEQYKTSLKKAKASVKKGDIPSYMETIERTAHESGVPTHMFGAPINVPTVIKPVLKNAAGDYGSGGRQHLVRLREGWKDRTKIGEEEYTHQSYGQGKPIANPNFHEMMRKYSTETDKFQPMFNGHDLGMSDLAHVVHSDGTAESYRYSKHGYPKDFGSDKTMNVFEGRGENTPEYSVSNFKTQVGYTKGSFRRKTAVFHTRMSRIPVGEPQQLTRPIYSERRSISGGGDTLVHELGHSIDPNINVFGFVNPKGYDSVKEGVAQGFEDRFSTHKDKLQSAVEPSEERAREFKKGGGYNALDKSTVAPTKFHGALYAAARIHASMGDNNYRDIENRRALSDKATKATGHEWKTTLGGVKFGTQPDGDRLLLGHLYTHHDHVRKMLNHLGPDFEAEGQLASEYYKSSMTDAAKSPTLPGMENLGERDR